jgi:hypothetical protein
VTGAFRRGPPCTFDPGGIVSMGGNRPQLKYRGRLIKNAVYKVTNNILFRNKNFISAGLHRSATDSADSGLLPRFSRRSAVLGWRSEGDESADRCRLKIYLSFELRALMADRAAWPYLGSQTTTSSRRPRADDRLSPSDGSGLGRKESP